MLMLATLGGNKISLLEQWTKIWFLNTMPKNSMNNILRVFIVKKRPQSKEITS